jgi:kynurenine formamidase
LDTPSIDYGKSQDFPVHSTVCTAGKLALEHIANLDKLPVKGAILYVILTNIKGVTGAPSRVFADLPCGLFSRICEWEHVKSFMF